MTANSPSSVAESASSTIDPDAQARRTNDGDLSAGMHSDLTIDEDAAVGLLTAEEPDVEFDENLIDGKLYAEYRRPADDTRRTTCHRSGSRRIRHQVPRRLRVPPPHPHQSSGQSASLHSGRHHSCVLPVRRDR